jgi:hypothetical protein
MPPPLLLDQEVARRFVAGRMKKERERCSREFTTFIVRPRCRYSPILIAPNCKKYNSQFASLQNFGG